MSKQSWLLAHAPPSAHAAAECNHLKYWLIFTVVSLCESSSFQMLLRARKNKGPFPTLDSEAGIL